MRRRSVLKSSYRRKSHEWALWLRWEFAKGAVLAGLIVVPDILGWYRTPAPLFYAILAGFILYMLLLYWDAWSAFSRMDKRRLQKLEALGCRSPELMKILRSKSAWKASLKGQTVQDVLRDRALYEHIEAETKEAGFPPSRE